MSIQEFRTADLMCADLHYRLTSEKQYETQILTIDEQTQKDMLERYSRTAGIVETLKPENAVEQLLKRHFTDFLDGEKRAIGAYFRDDSRMIGAAASKIGTCFENDTRPCEEKIPILIEALASCPRTDTDASDETENIIHYRDNIDAYFPDITGSLAADLEKSLNGILEKLSYGKNAVKVRNSDNGDYRGVLNDTLGVSLDDLLEWYETEIEKTRGMLYETASKLNIADNVKDIKGINTVLNKYAGACGTPEEMFERMGGYLERAREAAKSAVSFPDEMCELKGVPYPLRESFPWGGYSDGDGRKRPICGTVFLNNYNYKAVTDGWLKMQALHEAYPGHHIQYVRRIADTLPETLKLGAKYIPLIEGTAHRSEHLFESVFDEDKFFPLFVAYRRHHTSVRIKSDLMLRYFGKSADECAKLYMDELDFDQRTARGQVLAQQNMEGYFTCYYYGLKKITDFENRYAGSTREFTEDLFSCGNISMQNLEAYLKLSPDEKQSFFRDYETLIK